MLCIYNLREFLKLHENINNGSLKLHKMNIIVCADTIISISNVRVLI